MLRSAAVVAVLLVAGASLSYSLSCTNNVYSTPSPAWQYTHWLSYIRHGQVSFTGQEYFPNYNAGTMVTYDFYFKFCGQEMACGNHTYSLIQMEQGQTACFGLGTGTPTITPMDSYDAFIGLRYHLTGGTPAQNGQQMVQRVATIDFLCDPTAFLFQPFKSLGAPILLPASAHHGGHAQLLYRFETRTYAACPIFDCQVGASKCGNGVCTKEGCVCSQGFYQKTPSAPCTPIADVIPCGENMMTNADGSCQAVYPSYKNQKGALVALALFFCIFFLIAGLELAYLYRLTKGNLAYSDIDHDTKEVN